MGQPRASAGSWVNQQDGAAAKSPAPQGPAYRRGCPCIKRRERLVQQNNGANLAQGCGQGPARLRHAA